jgi:hypothetical protein
MQLGLRKSPVPSYLLFSRNCFLTLIFFQDFLSYKWLWSMHTTVKTIQNLKVQPKHHPPSKLLLKNDNNEWLLSLHHIFMVYFKYIYTHIYLHTHIHHIYIYYHDSLILWYTTTILTLVSYRGDKDNI